MLERLLRQDSSSGGDSDLWYRVARTRPRLSVHARVVRQTAGRNTWYIVDDPVSGQYYRISEAAYVFLGVLNGSRTVDDAFETCAAQLGDNSPTQRECFELLSKLQYHGLLTGNQPLGAGQVARRRTEAKLRRRKQRLGYGFSMTIRVLNPEPMLVKLEPLIRLVFSGWGFAAWMVVVIAGLYAAITNIDGFSGQLNGVLAPSNLVWLGAAFVVLRVWHEFGHACAVKAFGGRCTEVGIMLMAMIIPFPYCDASASWRFAEARNRVIVGAAGMLFETFLAAICAIVWVATEPGLVHTLAYNAMIISGVTTLVFNANPLLRYDGYYILCDLAGMPNLWTRSRELMKFLLEKVAFGVHSATPPILKDRGEFWLMVAYGTLSYPYRFLVLFTIIWVLWTHPSYFGLGALLAIVAAALWIVWPMLKTIGYLFWSSKLMGKRARALGIVGGLLAVVIGCAGLLPIAAPAYATAVVQPRAYQNVRAGEDGFVERVLVDVGEAVMPGQALAQMRNDDLVADLMRAQAALERSLAASDAAPSGPAGDMVIADLIVGQGRRDLDRAHARVDSLTVRATIAGRVATVPGGMASVRDVEGRFVSRGTGLFVVADVDSPRIRALVADREYGRVFEGGRMPRATVRVRGDAGHVRGATISRADPVGSKSIGEDSLTAPAGGEIVLDPEDRDGVRALRPYFIVELEPTALRVGDGVSENEVALLPGQRARVRFEGGSEPLLSQWIRQIRQTLSDRVGA